MWPLILFGPLLLHAGRPAADVTARTPMHFEPNMGQAHSSVLFIARAGARTTFLTSNETVIPIPGLKPVRMKFEGARPPRRFEPIERLPGVSNYYRGQDPCKWQSSIPHYSKLRAEGVYAGIDVVYYGNGHRLEFDFVVAPGANPGRIRMAYDGVERVRVDAVGDLLLETKGATLRQHKPTIYQATSVRDRSF